jgi:hypothetical protein
MYRTQEKHEVETLVVEPRSWLTFLKQALLGLLLRRMTWYVAAIAVPFLMALSGLTHPRVEVQRLADGSVAYTVDDNTRVFPPNEKFEVVEHVKQGKRGNETTQCLKPQSGGTEVCELPSGMAPLLAGVPFSNSDLVAHQHAGRNMGLGIFGLAIVLYFAVPTALASLRERKRRQQLPHVRVDTNEDTVALHVGEQAMTRYRLSNLGSVNRTAGNAIELIGRDGELSRIETSDWTNEEQDALVRILTERIKA